MAESIREVMTPDPRTVGPLDTMADAARAMAHDAVGAVLVVEDGRVTGIVTDRDIVVRGIAAGRDPDHTPVTEVFTHHPATLTTDQTVEDAMRLVRQEDVRRIPIVEQGGGPAGIVSIGDLAIEREEDTTLADVSSELPNN
jgi:CBS domain-containing protein